MYCQSANNIANQFVFNVDETAVQLLNLGARGWIEARNQSQRILLLGSDDKRVVIFTLVWSKAFGVSMFGQFIFEGKIDVVTNNLRIRSRVQCE